VFEKYKQSAIPLELRNKQMGLIASADHIDITTGGLLVDGHGHLSYRATRKLGFGA
jgi:hypothetical protein